MESLEIDTVYCLDCIEGMRKIPDGTVDLVFADPPFNIGYQYDVYRVNSMMMSIWNWCRWTGEIARILSPRHLLAGPRY